MEDLEQARSNAIATISNLFDELNDEFVTQQKHQSAFYVLKRMLADEYLRDRDKTDKDVLVAIDGSIGLDGASREEVAATWRSRSAAWVSIAISQLDPTRRACMIAINAAETAEQAWEAVHAADYEMRQMVEAALK